MKVSAATPVCDLTCPVQRTAQLLDGKWTILVLRDLLGGTKRYSELQRSLAGISPRLLAARLKGLEAQGIVLRTAYATVPPTTEYALTPLGQALLPLIEAMAMVGQTLLEQDAQAARTRALALAARTPAGVTRVRGGRRVAET